LTYVQQHVSKTLSLDVSYTNKYLNKLAIYCIQTISNPRQKYLLTVKGLALYQEL